MLWRHGRTEWNQQNRFQGHSDVPLDDFGIHQAKEAAKILAYLKPSKIISSDLERAANTAEELSKLVGIPVDIDANLRETNGGSWEGMYRDELDEHHGEEIRAWASGSDLAPGGHGERRSEVAARMTSSIEDALLEVPDDGVLVVATHGGAARAALCSMLGLDPSSWGIFGILMNCSWCILHEGGASTGPKLSQMYVERSERFPDIPPMPAWRLEVYNGVAMGAVLEPASGDDR